MKNSLLPYPCKFVGWFLVVAGITMGVFYVWFDFRFKMPVFAVYSSFLETKIFASFSTNFADELILIVLLAGFFLVVFSKEKNETENLNLIRYKALVRAVIINSVFMLLSLLFVYGSGFISILVFNIFSLSVFYLLFFFIQKRKNN